eukprot:849163-Lingulodinium_polyedra.AAC.1
MNSARTCRPRDDGHIMATYESSECTTSHPLHWTSGPQDWHSCRPTTAEMPNQRWREVPNSSTQDSLARATLNETNFATRKPTSRCWHAPPLERRPL